MAKELEMRYRLSNQQAESIPELLQQKGWKGHEQRQQDQYYCPAELVALKRTAERKFILRLRTNQNEESELTYKAFAPGGGWIEIETPIGDPTTMEQILQHIDMAEFLVIKKFRRSGKLGGVEINIDEIEKLGTFIELEVMTTQIDAGLKKLADTAAELDLNHNQQITDGYVQLMEQALLTSD